MKIVVRRIVGLVLLVLALAPMVGSAGVLAQADTPDSPDQQLAERYAPIVMLRGQDAPCDSEGEQYAPTAVDIVLDNPDVLLRQVGNDDPVLMRAPGAADLFERSEGFYLDFPGSALQPGCIYETDFDRYSGTVPGDRRALVYAHIARQEDRPDEIALQYWFYWYFNDWNNKHEGDWEGIQLVFEASSVEEALASEPISVGYAQHEGGERAEWDSSKLQREGDRPVVYPSAGSHASYFGSALYLGRSGGEGFGCDTTFGPSDRIPADIVLLPTTVDDPSDPLAWLSFGGRWGERQSGPFNGPTGPTDKERWEQPIDWQDSLRSSSVVVPSGDSQGEAVVNTFCDVVELGSGLLITLRISPVRMLIGAIFLVLGGRWAVRRTAWSPAVEGQLVQRRRAGQILRAAASEYRHNAGPFIVFGLVFLPTALIIGFLVALLTKLPLVSQMVELAGDLSATRVLFVLVSQNFANLISYVAVNTMVASYFGMQARGDDRRPLVAVAEAWKRAPMIAVEYAKALAIVTLLMVSVVGIPWGIRQLVRYQLMPQAMVLEGLGRGQGLRRSAELVRGRWWHTAAMVALFNASIAGVGMAIGLLLLVVGSGMPLWLFSGLITLVYALIVPLAAVAQTLLYGDAVAEERGMVAGDDSTAVGEQKERHADDESSGVTLDQL